MILPYDSAGTIGNTIEWLENVRVKKKHVAPDNGCTTLTYQINPNKFLGRSKPLSDPELKGSATSNPTEQCYWYIGVSNLDGVTDLSPLHVTFSIEYQAILIEPKMPPTS